MLSVWKKNNRLRLRTSDEFHYTRLNDKMLHKQKDDDVNMKEKKIHKSYPASCSDHGHVSWTR